MSSAKYSPRSDNFQSENVFSSAPQQPRTNKRAKIIKIGVLVSIIAVIAIVGIVLCSLHVNSDGSSGEQLISADELNPNLDVASINSDLNSDLNDINFNSVGQEMHGNLSILIIDAKLNNYDTVTIGSTDSYVEVDLKGNLNINFFLSKLVL